MNQPLGVALAVRRQGWDITNVDASSSLVNSQTSATVRFVTNGDGYAAAGFGVQIDATGPIINPVKSVNRTVAGVGIFSLIRLRSQIQEQEVQKTLYYVIVFRTERRLLQVVLR